MFVSSCVKNRVRFVRPEDRCDTLFVADVSDHRDEQNISEIRSELVKNVEDRVFAMTQQN